MPTMPRSDNYKLDIFKSTGMDYLKVAALKPLSFTDIEITSQLGARPGIMINSLILSPNKPRSGESFLSFHAAVMVEANPASSNNIALFSSAFPSVNNPSVQLEFATIKPGKKHLVEFNITFNEPAKVYKFRLIQFPTATYQDVSVSGTQVLSILIPSIPDYPYSYGAALNQLNTKAEACGWIFHSVKISAVD